MDGFVARLNTFAAAWFGWMFHMSWQVALLAGVVWLAVTLSRKSCARFRHLLWVLVFVRLVLPPELATPWSAGSLLTKLPVHVTRGVTPEIEVGVSGPAPLGRATSQPGAERPPLHRETAPRVTPATVAMGVWAAVALGLFGLLALQWRIYSRKVLRGVSRAPESVENVFRAQLDALGFRAPVPLRVSHAITTPGVFGLWRPMILLPPEWEKQFSHAELAAVIAHELAHIRRGDLLMALGTSILSCLYWFHPVVWLVNLILRREREMACDDMVVQSTKQAGKEYASTLLHVAEFFEGGAPVGAGLLGLLELSDNLLHRIRSIGDNSRARRLGWGSVVGLVVVLLLMPMGVWTATAAAPKPSSPPPTSAGEPTGGTAPKTISVSPPIGTANVDPGTTEIRVTFDQDMNMEGYSWTGGGEFYPKTTGKPLWVDARTCVLPVALEPAKFYRVGVNSKSHRNFRGVNGLPAELEVVYFATQGASDADLAALHPPQVVAMNPQNGLKNVTPTLTELSVTFDQAMGAGFSWTIAAGKDHYPETTGQPVWSEDRKTCTLPVKLKPAWTYAIGLNHPSANNFQSDHGVPLKPVNWEFATGE